MAYKIVYAIFYAMSLLPYRVMYCISDFFYLIIYYIEHLDASFIAQRKPLLGLRVAQLSLSRVHSGKI